MKIPALCILAGLLAGSLHAGDTNTTPGWLCGGTGGDGKYLTGSWGGLRDRLEAQGIDLFAFYTTDPAGDPVGGKSHNFNYADDWFFGVNLSLDKLVGWQGAKFVVNAINRDGGNSVQSGVGGVYNPQQTVGGQDLFLYNVTLEQLFFDGKFSIKAGRMSESDDFNSSPIYNLYLTNAIDGDIRNVLFDTQFSAYPFPTWAARLAYDPTPDWHAKFGIFQNTSHVFDPNRHGLDWTISGKDGPMMIAQVGWTPHLFKQTQPAPAAPGDKNFCGDPKPQEEEQGLPGHYIFGGSFSPWKGYAQFDKNHLAGQSYGIYAHADQMVYQQKPGTDQGLVLWAAAGYYPQQNISIVPFQVNAGFVYQGLIPKREDDKLIFGFTYGKFSRDYARTIDATGAGHPNHEIVIEADYRFQLTKFLYLQPDVQGVIDPGGTGRIPDALVLGAQSTVVF